MLLKELNDAILKKTVTESEDSTHDQFKRALNTALSTIDVETLFYSGYSMYRGEGGQGSMKQYISHELGEELATAYMRAINELENLSNLITW